MDEALREPTGENRKAVRLRTLGYFLVGATAGSVSVRLGLSLSDLGDVEEWFSGDISAWTEVGASVAFGALAALQYRRSRT